MIAWPSLELLARLQYDLDGSHATVERCDQCHEPTYGERVVRTLQGDFGHAYCLLGYNV